jgi:hypothetical protein
MILNYVDYLTAHVVHLCIAVTLIATEPLYTISVADPVLEANAAATQSYEIMCYAFYGKVVGRGGNTECTSYEYDLPSLSLSVLSLSALCVCALC